MVCAFASGSERFLLFDGTDGEEIYKGNAVRFSEQSIATECSRGDAVPASVSKSGKSYYTRKISARGW
jgi:hypothetical protein